MSSRGAMVQRMDVQRDMAESSGDDYDHVEDWQTLHQGIPCRFWIRASPRLVATQETITGNIEAVIRDARVMCPLVDIRERDRISEIRDRLGNVQITGPLDIRGIEPRWVGDKHLELLIREIS